MTRGRVGGVGDGDGDGEGTGCQNTSDSVVPRRLVELKPEHEIAIVNEAVIESVRIRGTVYRGNWDGGNGCEGVATATSQRSHSPLAVRPPVFRSPGYITQPVQGEWGCVNARVGMGIGESAIGG